MNVNARGFSRFHSGGFVSIRDDFSMSCDLILVLDAQSPGEVLPILRHLQGTVRWVKVGLEMYTACGPEAVREIAELGFNVFLDLKLHDIPNTVAKAVESAARLPIKMLTLHTSGGTEMMRWAVKAQQTHAPDLLLLGVTVLTSLGEPDLRAIGYTLTPEAQVLRLGRLAVDAGLRGLVCSPLELPVLRAELPADVQLVTPGIRPAGAAVGDQTRIMTPGNAAAAGASYIVVGRPIFQAPDPAAAARAILTELSMKRGADAGRQN
jgi:orotidine-5'-phosphate decarboxylase